MYDINNILTSKTSNRPWRGWRDESFIHTRARESKYVKMLLPYIVAHRVAPKQTDLNNKLLNIAKSFEIMKASNRNDLKMALQKVAKQIHSNLVAEPEKTQEFMNFSISNYILNGFHRNKWRGTTTFTARLLNEKRNNFDRINRVSESAHFRMLHPSPSNYNAEVVESLLGTSKDHFRSLQNPIFIPTADELNTVLQGKHTIEMIEMILDRGAIPNEQSHSIANRLGLSNKIKKLLSAPWSGKDTLWGNIFSREETPESGNVEKELDLWRLREARAYPRNETNSSNGRRSHHRPHTPNRKR